MNPNEYYEFEDRAYVNPTLSRDEQLGFVDTLRNTVGKDTARINTQTQRLGKNISPNFGGLAGSNSYFTQRYQTTPLQSQVNTLKATAQSKALNDLLTNYQNQAANRYSQAYRAYNKRNSNNSNGTNDLNEALKSLLGITTESGKTTEDVTPGAGKGIAWTMETDADGNLYWVLGNFANPYYGYERVPLKQVESNILLQLPGNATAKPGMQRTIGGKNYIYLDSGQDKAGWYEYGTAQLVPGTGE